METPTITCCSFPISEWLDLTTDHPNLRGTWIEVPHGTYRASWGCAWHYVRGDEMIEVIIDQAESVYVLYFDKNGNRQTIKHFTIDPEDHTEHDVRTSAKISSHSDRSSSARHSRSLV